MRDATGVTYPVIRVEERGSLTLGTLWFLDNKEPTKALELLAIDGMDGEVAQLFLNEEQANRFIAEFRKAKATLWPKKLAPLCPASSSLLTYLRKYDGITPLKAREELGIEHLPRRVKDLKEHGHEIRTEIKKGFAGKRYAHYSLAKPTEPKGPA